MSTETPWRHWRMERDQDDIAWLTLDRADSGTNSLSGEVVEELDAVLSALAEKLPKALVIRSGKGNGFIAGADVREFTRITDRDQALALIQRGQAILGRIERLPLPTLALIDGFCLGGGLELALACRYRIATDDPATRLGLPEVQLGIHPGFGGTVRLTRLIGPLSGLELMLTGRTVNAKAARKLGLVNAVTAGRHLERAARTLALQPPKAFRKPWRERLAELPLVRDLVVKLMRRTLERKADRRHYPAPYALLDLWQGFSASETANYAAEAASVAELIVSDSARNLVRVFLLQEQLKATGRQDTTPLQRVHVVGGGIMGGDIAIWCALQGLLVTVQDVDPQRLGQVVQRGRALFTKKLKDRRAIEAAVDRLLPDPDGHGVSRADLVIEAIFEDADAKRELYRQIEPLLKPEAILASNTSSIPLEELATALDRPGRLIGLHFFNPVAKMQLVEVVSAAQSDPEALARGAAFVRGIKRLPLPVKSSPGFLVNRILMPYLLEAVRLVEEGVTPETIDQAATDFGMPMGPIRLADTVGLDICLSVARILANHYPVDVPERLQRMVAAGQLGRKSGQGFYVYRGKARKVRGPQSVPPEIGERLVLRLLNEAVACRREQVVENADLLDAGVIYGTGFAPFRGGPMQHIQSVGVNPLLERLKALTERHGDRFTPDNGWFALAQEEKKQHDSGD
ncbi:3-hydroxyacyl-CoA dehydrogenase NAD-binding domain-containing protein [Pelovirga terrestris]|uniref:enoyl-CoA hydratase n=1 Tax=Pelovirga terrestris TaxID=2771352 RepID=A0A8J6UQ85_9BACT|nr:3-hydroxyacyl-CoA dehydrogenase NAD-binding domain-containing protein [Pelovirga terrestris]MBD1401759.1 enoyl-CoA hydratase/isomerase family protein [Pelovirga terrestris]